MPNIFPENALVNGTQKTGTTWLIRLLSSIPGHHYAGNFKGSISQYQFVSPGDILHGHDRFSPELAKIIRNNQIHLITCLRDPRDQIISNMFHLKRDPNTPLYDIMQDLDQTQAINLLIGGKPGFIGSINNVYGISLSWINNYDSLLVVKYEDLLFETNTIFNKTLEWLNIHVHQSLLDNIILLNSFKRLTVGKKSGKNRESLEKKIELHISAKVSSGTGKITFLQFTYFDSRILLVSC